jgi:hypothetical protein
MIIGEEDLQEQRGHADHRPHGSCSTLPVVP